MPSTDIYTIRLSFRIEGNIEAANKAEKDSDP